ncbi:Rz1-like lysis system protein LysC [Erwinia persicina]|uniref:Rz1-like lysis system protein LysC n=1 Tax=Erwinia persicina TaxID=55211 RepID=UPI001C9B62AC|nr:Rz1-like lysis system protein LysC [Erwinia persicina]QZQ49700.1 Rz1-like lysis system protein LysC [Erwinia persicina]
MRHYKTGAMLLCLTGLSGCSSTPLSPPPVIIWRGCPVISSCPVPAVQPETQGDLLTAIRQLEQALLTCGLQVETLKQCQEQHDVKTQTTARGLTGPRTRSAESP